MKFMTYVIWTMSWGPVLILNVVSEGFIRWARVKGAGTAPCRIEKSINCLPLEDDEICLGCYELHREVRRARNAASFQRRKNERNIRNDRMSRDPDDLVLPVRLRLEKLQAAAAREATGFIVTYTLRTVAEQHALFAQGRKPLDEVNRLRKEAGLAAITQRENRIVTKLLTSIHQFGCAFDIAIVKNGRPDWNDTAQYERLGAIGESLGLRWGGRFKFRDLCHFEYTGGLTLAQLEKGERPTA